MNEDPRWFLDDKVDECWITWKVGRSLDSPPVTFKKIFMYHFIPRRMRVMVDLVRGSDGLREDPVATVDLQGL